MNDEIDEIEAIHRVRRELSARFGHDLHRYVEFLQEQERQHPERMASPETIARLLSKPIAQSTNDEDAA